MSTNQSFLLVDGKNALYRSFYAARNKPDVHPVAVLIRLLLGWCRVNRPQSIFWCMDTPSSDIWRLKLLPQYKATSARGAIDADVGNDLRDLNAKVAELLPHLGIRVVTKPTQEADDLIYAGCRLFNPVKCVVVSSDSDLLQLPDTFRHAVVFDPANGKTINTSQGNCVLLKALSGDRSDNIPGVGGIGVVKAAECVEDRAKLGALLEDPSTLQKFKRNLILVDLSLNPQVYNNLLYMAECHGKPVVHDYQTFKSLCSDWKINGVIGELNSIMSMTSNLR